VSPELDTWNEWSRHVLKELERLNASTGDIYEKVNQVRIEIAMLKVKAGIWGAIGGAIPVVVALAMWILKK